MPAKTAAKPSSKCRGKWSVCGGKFQQKSDSWHICDSCTKKRAAAMKAQKDKAASKPAAPAKPKVAKAEAPMAAKRGSTVAARPPRKPIARVRFPEPQPAVVQVVAPAR